VQVKMGQKHCHKNLLSEVVLAYRTNQSDLIQPYVEQIYHLLEV
jgi:hypothetical protein